MIYIDDYAVEEKRNAFFVSVIWEEETRVRISKKYIEDLKLNEDPEVVAVLLAVIEFARVHNRAWNKQPRRNLLKNEDILNKIKILVEGRMPIDYLTSFLSQMKYDEMARFFEEAEY